MLQVRALSSRSSCGVSAEGAGWQTLERRCGRGGLGAGDSGAMAEAAWSAASGDTSLWAVCAVARSVDGLLALAKLSKVVFELVSGYPGRL